MKEITKEYLEEVYYNNTNEKAAEIIGVTKVTLMKYLKKAGVKLKGGPKPKVSIYG